MEKRRVFLIVGCLVLALIIVLTVLAVIDKGNKPEDYIIKPSNTEVVNLENVVGKREVISDKVEDVLLENENIVIKHSYKYVSKDSNKDAKKYANIIARKGFLPMTDYDFSQKEASFLFGKNLDDSAVICTIIYKENEIELVFWETEGLLAGGQTIDQDVLNSLNESLLDSENAQEKEKSDSNGN